MRTDDPTMELMRQTAFHLGLPTALPRALEGATLREATEKRTALLKEVGNIIEVDVRAVQNAVADPWDVPAQVPLLVKRLEMNLALHQLRLEHLADVPDEKQQTGIALALYAGYMDAAKVISAGTKYERNNATTRKRDIPTIEAKAAGNPVYAAGVEAAPQFKHRELREDIYRDGIPDGSIVLRDWDD